MYCIVLLFSAVSIFKPLYWFVYICKKEYSFTLQSISESTNNELFESMEFEMLRCGVRKESKEKENTDKNRKLRAWKAASDN